MTPAVEHRFACWASATVYDRREDFLARHLGEGRTLDVGCIDERKPEAIATSLHAFVAEHCESVVGIDVDDDAARIARDHGFEVLVRDACRDDLGGPYDRIVAGEIIEHVTSVECLLRNLARHLQPAGCILLTTPNATSLRQQGKILRHGHPQVHARHTLWFDATTLEETVERCGLVIVERAWLAPTRGLLVRALARWRRPWNEGLMVRLEHPRGSSATVQGDSGSTP
ncbi:MAG: class I SAM-dependent methyltransferase [Planctomycetes bacterium]|nr:class I SAM-dependent methyltransferase [Planctomycetota bacterium]